jgi:DNA ligase 1
MSVAAPTLYKKTSTGAIQWWDIAVEVAEGGGVIITRYGQVGTPNPQETRDYVTVGKNIGKTNETSPLQQAFAEAKAKHEMQRKKGYVDSQEKAEAGELDELVQGGILPMLAHDFSKHGHKIVYPVYAQPKLDGMRCYIRVEKGKASLWSRQRNPIIAAPHIIEELEGMFTGYGYGDHEFDGELYNHDMKNDFERFMSLVRQKDEPHPDHRLIQFHAYDLPMPDTPFWLRNERLATYFIHKEFGKGASAFRYVDTFLIENETGVIEALTLARLRGYEGLILRNSDGLYVNKRSYDLQKVKEFDDGEFRIIGITEGRGKLAGHAATFVCVMPDTDQTFEAKMTGDTGRLKNFWNDHSLWQGKMLTVKYQGLTGKNGVPRFPVGVTFRDYE